MQRPPLNLGQFIDGLSKDPPEIMMMTATATQLVYYQQSLGKIGLGFKHSANVDYYELGNIADKIELGTLPAFSFLKCFDRLIWFSILWWSLWRSWLLFSEKDSM